MAQANNWGMQCSEVRQRLVALQDGELSASERAHTLEHLTTCAECAELERRLDAVTPEPSLEIPFAVRRRFHDQLDHAVRTALDDAVLPLSEPPSAWQRLAAWLGRDTDVPVGAVLAYAFVLALAIGWGFSNWLTVQDLADRPVATSPAAASPEEPVAIPGDQYRPAAYTPDTDVLH